MKYIVLFWLSTDCIHFINTRLETLLQYSLNKVYNPKKIKIIAFIVKHIYIFFLDFFLYHVFREGKSKFF